MRRDCCFLLIIGHTRLTYPNLINGEYVPRCVACGCELTVKHILIECGETECARQEYYDADNLRQRFQEINVTDVFVLLWEIVLFHRIQVFTLCDNS